MTSATAARRLARVVVIVALLAPVAPALALELPGTEALRQKLESVLAAGVGGEARIGTLRLHPLDGSIEVDDFELRPGQGAVDSLVIEHARLRVALGEWLAHGASMDALRILEIEADGLDVSMVAKHGPSKPRTGPLFPGQWLERLENIRISRGIFRHADSAIDLAIDVRGIRIDSTGNVPVLAGGFVAGPIKFSASGVPEQHLDRLRLDWTWNAPRIEFTILEARGPSGDYTGRGLVSLTRLGILATGSIEGTSDIATVLADPEQPLRGRVRVSAAFRAVDPGVTELSGQLQGDGPLLVSGLRLDETRARFALGEHGIELLDGYARLPGGTVVDDFSYARLKDAGWHVHATGDAAIPELLQLVKAGPRAAQLHGRARFRFDASSAERDEPARWTITADLGPGRAELGALGGRVDGSGDANGGRIAVLGKLDQAAVDLVMTWPAGGLRERWTVVGELSAAPGAPAKSAREDVLRYLADEQIDLPKGTLPYANGAFTLGVRFEGRGNDVLLADLPFRLESPSYGTLPLERLEGRVLLGPRGRWEVTFRLADRNANGLDGRLAGAPGVPVAVDATARRFPLDVAREYVFGAFDLDLPAAAGTLDGFVAGRLAYSVRELTVGATLRGRVARAPESVLVVNGRVLGDEADVRSAHLTSEGLTADFTGSIALPGGLRPWGIAGRLGAELDLGRVLGAMGQPGNAGRIALRTDVRFDGTERPLVANGELFWRGLEVADVPLPDGGGRLFPLDDGTRFVLDTPRWTGEARVTGPLVNPQLATHLAWNDLPLFEFLSVLTRRHLALGVDLRTDGRLELDGPLKRPDLWHGAARLDTFDMRGGAIGVRLAKPVDIVFRGDGRARTIEEAPITLLGSAGGRIDVAGGVEVFGANVGKLDVHLAGSTDMTIIEVFDPDLVGSGELSADLAITGYFRAPEITGRIVLDNGRVRLFPFTDAVDRLQGRIELTPGLATFSDTSFELGGGSVGVEGTLTMNGWIPGRFDLRARGREVALNIPKGVWGRYNAELEVHGQASEPEVSGNIEMLAGRYTNPFKIEGTPGARARRVEPTTSRSHWITRIALKLHVTATESIAVRNDIARMQASANLDLTGDVGQVQMGGAITLIEGGRLQFRGIDLEVQSGQVTFDDARGTPMTMHLVLTTDLRGYNIRLEIDFSDTLDYRLTSTPALSRSDILVLLLTGQTPEESTSGSQQLSTELATSYFGSQLGEMLLSGTARRVLGVSRFQIAPSTIGAETRPTARVTVGKRVDDKTMVLYSRDLSAEARDVYQVERELTRRLRVTLGSEALGGVAANLRWLRRLGESTAPDDAAVGVPHLRSVSLDGTPPGMHLRVRKDLGITVGDRVPKFQLIEAREKLARELAQAGYLSAHVTYTLDNVPKGRAAVFTIDPGPRWDVRYEGPAFATRRARDVLSALWGETVFRADDTREAVRVLREALWDDGYGTATADIAIDPAKLTLDVSVDPGPKTSVGRIAFEGVRELSEKDLSEQVLTRPSGVLGVTVLGSGAVYRPRGVAEDADAIRSLYADEGFLETRVEPRIRFRGAGETADVTFVVDEGPHAKIGRVRVDGDWPGSLGSALGRTGLKSDMLYNPRLLRAAESALRGALDDAGYWDATIKTRPEVRAGVVDVLFSVQARRAATVDSVVYSGLVHTRPKIVEDATFVTPQQPLRSADLRRTESELLRLGVFRKVQVLTEPAGDDPSRQKVLIRLDEMPRLSVLTSLGYGTEERYQGSVSFSNDNLWGLARTGSIQAYGSALRSGLRATLEDRHLAKGRIEGLLAAGLDREEKTGFTLQTTGITLQIGTPIVRRDLRWQLRYVIDDNRVSHVTIDEESIDAILNDQGRRISVIRLGSVQGSAILDRRDDPFLPSKGWFARADAGVWAKPLLSEATFVRVTGQIAGYKPRGRLVLAGSARVGFAWPLAETTVVPLSQRFFLGGSDSMRGFGRDEVGPQDSRGNALGGESMFLANLEARYKFWGDLNALVFYDVGNAFLRANDFYRGNLRKDAGVGLRYNTAMGALRVEYGWKIDRQPDESPGQFFFSIGEAF